MLDKLTVENIALAITAVTLLWGFGTMVVRSGQAYRILGRIETTMRQTAARLKEHSDTLKDHEALLLRLEFLPVSVADMKKDIHSIKDDVQSIRNDLKRNGNSDDKGNGD